MEIKNPKDLEKLIKLARKNGLTSLKLGEVSFEMAPSALFPESAYKRKQKEENVSTSDLVVVENAYSEADLLDWSSGTSS